MGKFQSAECRSLPLHLRKVNQMNDLAALAQRWGIEPGYHDVFGAWHAASAETLRTLIGALSHGRTAPKPLEPAPAVAPMRAWQGDGRRLWALAVQLYSLRSGRNWGYGDFSDLAHLIEIAAVRGAKESVDCTPRVQLPPRPDLVVRQGSHLKRALGPFFFSS